MEMKDLRFNLTEDMNNTMIQMLIVNQMLKENKKLSKKERKLLEQHKNELLEIFRIEFRRNNIEQIKQIAELSLSANPFFCPASYTSFATL